VTRPAVLLAAAGVAFAAVAACSDGGDGGDVVLAEGRLGEEAWVVRVISREGDTCLELHTGSGVCAFDPDGPPPRVEHTSGRVGGGVVVFGAVPSRTARLVAELPNGARQEVQVVRRDGADGSEPDYFALALADDGGGPIVLRALDDDGEVVAETEAVTTTSPPTTG
jgi:hypothetical protein